MQERGPAALQDAGAGDSPWPGRPRRERHREPRPAAGSHSEEGGGHEGRAKDCQTRRPGDRVQ